MGQVVDNQPAISNILPDIAAPPSPWFVTQWQQNLYISPGSLVFKDAEHSDALLGTPTYAFYAADHHSSVRIYVGPNQTTYELFQRGGVLTPGGGSNLFLSRNFDGNNISFARTLIYSVDAKISDAAVTYYSERSAHNDSVLSQIFSGFGLSLLGKWFVFMQIPISSSRAIVKADEISLRCLNNERQLLYSPAFTAGEDLLQFKQEKGAPKRLHYNLTTYLKQLLDVNYICQGKNFSWPREARQLGNWRITGMYVGLETNNSDKRPSSRQLGPQGDIETGLQLSDLKLEAW